jgi:hypothetical protein
MSTLKDRFYANKINAATKIICLFWLVAKAMSWKVWLAKRVFPLLPPFRFLYVHESVHLIFFILSLLALATLFIFSSKKLLLPLVISCEIASCILDQNRWQPWEYEYIFIILAMLINYKNKSNAITSIIFLFVTIYFYSGINKMNPIFSQYLVNTGIRHNIFHNSNTYFYNFLIYHIGYFLGSIEMLLGIGLLFPKVKKTSAVLLLLMHMGIVILFGPWGINYDVIIIPWNIAFSLILCLFFIYKPLKQFEFAELFKNKNLIFVLFFGILPAFNFFGYWDYFLSSSFFSYKPPDMYIWIHKEGVNNALRPFFTINKNDNAHDSNSAFVNVRNWAFQEMKVPAYPELRTYKAIKEALTKQFPDMNASFIVYHYLNGKKVRIDLK